MPCIFPSREEEISHALNDTLSEPYFCQDDNKWEDDYLECIDLNDDASPVPQPLIQVTDDRNISELRTSTSNHNYSLSNFETPDRSSSEIIEQPTIDLIQVSQMCDWGIVSHSTPNTRALIASVPVLLEKLTESAACPALSYANQKSLQVQRMINHLGSILRKCDHRSLLEFMPPYKMRLMLDSIMHDIDNTDVETFKNLNKLTWSKWKVSHVL